VASLLNTDLSRGGAGVLHRTPAPPLAHIHPSSQSMNSPTFAARNSHLAYKDCPYGRCALHHMIATLALINLRRGYDESRPSMEGGQKKCC
jgi:hypothetical protein